MSTQTSAVPETVMNLLAEFERQPNCEAYKADSAKVQLICTYLWLRQLTDGLTFERFLEKFATIADFNDENRKHPEDAAKYFCPRAKKQADAQGMPQWTAEEVVDILALYVDIVRECERTGIEVPLTLARYLETEGPAYKRGELPPPEPAKRRNAGGGGKRKAGGVAVEQTPEQLQVAAATGVVDNPTAPTAANQRVIYSPPHWQGQQVKGVTRDVREEGGRRLADFATDAGELFVNCDASHCTVIQEALPVVPQAYERKSLLIPAANYPMIRDALALNQPMGNVQVGGLIHTYNVPFDCGVVVDINVVNGETGPFVDSQLAANGETQDILAELPPRRSILGEFRYETSAGWLVVDVSTRGHV